MEKEILQLFLYEKKLKFSEIEKSLNIRSNKIAYHLKNLVKRKILEKSDDDYQLTETAEKIIPYLSEKNSPLPVILVAVFKNKNKVFLHKRNKRPFKEKLSLPGGRIFEGESVKEAVKRIMKKYFIEANLKKINSVSLEQVKKQKRKIHSFLLILVTAETKDKILFTNIEKNKSKIISSDYKLMKNDLDKEIKINKFLTRD